MNTGVCARRQQEMERRQSRLPTVRPQIMKRVQRSVAARGRHTAHASRQRRRKGGSDVPAWHARQDHRVRRSRPAYAAGRKNRRSGNTPPTASRQREPRVEGDYTGKAGGVRLYRFKRAMPTIPSAWGSQHVRRGKGKSNPLHYAYQSSGRRAQVMSSEGQTQRLRRQHRCWQPEGCSYALIVRALTSRLPQERVPRP